MAADASNAVFKTVGSWSFRAGLYVNGAAEERDEVERQGLLPDSNAGGKPRNLAALSGTARIRTAISERAAAIC